MNYREPIELPESQESGECDDCGLKFDDITFVWYGEEGVGECPECLRQIIRERPEPDFDRDDYDYMRRHRL